MVKKIFISYSFKFRESYKDFHLKLKEFLKEKYSIESHAFVFDFTEKVEDRDLMDAALGEIDNSDLIMVELSNKSVGVGLEAGYAKAKGKTVVYLYKKGSDLQQTVNGIADYVIEYSDVDDVLAWLEENEKLFV